MLYEAATSRLTSVVRHELLDPRSPHVKHIGIFSTQIGQRYDVVSFPALDTSVITLHSGAIIPTHNFDAGLIGVVYRTVRVEVGLRVERIEDCIVHACATSSVSNYKRSALVNNLQDNRVKYDGS